MAELFLSVQLDKDRTMYVAPLTDRRAAQSGQDVADRSGYFLFEKRGPGEAGEVEIIARLVSEEAALRVAAMLNMR